MGNNHSNLDSNLISEFNDWLHDMEVDDIPCVGKLFTWFRPNGSCKSKLDRVLVSDAWLSKWPDSSQFILGRNYSNQCPVFMQSKCIDWGPKPFKVFDGWLMNKDYHKVVKECWSDTKLTGWGGYVLKCKLQILKQRLKIWSKENFGDLGNKVKQIQQKLNDMENALPVQPSDQQIQELKKTQADLWEKATIHEACLRQKSRSRWIKEGDNNTSYFHRSIKYSRRRNAVRGLLIDIRLV